MNRFIKQMLRVNPFEGDSKPSRVKLFAPMEGRPSLPFPHPWNYSQPIRILETFFWNAEKEQGSAQNNRYLDVFGFSPVLVSRDPGIIKAILSATGDQPGQFDRDTMPSKGIARATGKDTLLYANGPLWRIQKKLAAPAFSKSSLFHPERFQDFEVTFRQTIAQRIDVLQKHLIESGQKEIRVQLEPEIKAVMLEMLANNFFGAQIPYEQIRNKYVPALERVIDHIVNDTVTNMLEIPINKMPNLTPRIKKVKDDLKVFEELTDLAIAPRSQGRGLWSQFKSDATNEALRSNIRVFLAGALEATTSFASWALSHLSHHPDIQEQVYQEVKNINAYTPDNLDLAKQLTWVLEETLRLSPALYFLPRKATVDTWIETIDKRRIRIPKGTHILLDVWHANRLEEYWGVKVTGFPALNFAPARWKVLESKGYGPKDLMHYGFGHGPRVCPGKFLGQLEVGLVVGAVVKVFKFRAANPDNLARAGVSTKPADGVEVFLQLR